MKVYNLEERPSSNFKAKHPIIGLPLGQREREREANEGRTNWRIGAFCLRERESGPRSRKCGREPFEKQAQGEATVPLPI